ncbi:hypothetical protein EIM50_15660 [Pseudoxanthomonas sp. SGD-10]|nr:hypothetical protein EIM50_15660 [Pseudoxanthomonas sp. SGD-10]
MNIKWYNSAVDELTDIVIQLEKISQPYYAKRLERKILAKIKRISRGNVGFGAFTIDMCKVDYRITDKDLRVLRISLLRPIGVKFIP